MLLASYWWPPGSPMACVEIRPFEMEPFQQSIEVKCWMLIRDMTRGQTNLTEVPSTFTAQLVQAFSRCTVKLRVWFICVSLANLDQFGWDSEAKSGDPMQRSSVLQNAFIVKNLKLQSVHFVFHFYLMIWCVDISFGSIAPHHKTLTSA